MTFHVLLQPAVSDGDQVNRGYVLACKRPEGRPRPCGRLGWLDFEVAAASAPASQHDHQLRLGEYLSTY